MRKSASSGSATASSNDSFHTGLKPLLLIVLVYRASGILGSTTAAAAPATAAPGNLVMATVRRDTGNLNLHKRINHLAPIMLLRFRQLLPTDDLWRRDRLGAQQSPQQQCMLASRLHSPARTHCATRTHGSRHGRCTQPRCGSPHRRTCSFRCMARCVDGAFGLNARAGSRSGSGFNR